MQRRLIVELWHSADARSLRAAAEFALVLDLDLHGLFVEDEALLALAELPFARELRLPSHEWQPIEADRIATELRHAAVDARRLLHETAAMLGVPSAFEVWRGDPADAIAAVASTSDVVVIAEPDAPGSRIAPALARLHDAARGSAASLLLLPGGFVPRHGPVVALLTDADDPGLAPAVHAALSTKDRLLVLLPHDDFDMAEKLMQRAAALGLPQSRISIRVVRGFHSQDMLYALGQTRERLIILTRGASSAGNAAVAARIAEDRAVPVLLVEQSAPPAPKAAGTWPDRSTGGDSR